MRVGVDVGGTHTDAVLMDGSEVIAYAKKTTSSDVATGILDALSALPLEAFSDRIELAVIGTTQFTNAVAEREQLSKVTVVRASAPSGRGLNPRLDWPSDIAAATDGGAYVVAGGNLYSGEELAPLNQREIDAAIEQIRASKVREVCISAPFSHCFPELEQKLERDFLSAIPDLSLTLSSQFGSLGLIERESAAILNAALRQFAQFVCKGFQLALDKSGLVCPIFVSRNDGTVASLETVKKFPATTFSSGPTNSLRGASKLTGLLDAIVVDIGGTTSDIGVIENGFPRTSGLTVDVCGVRTNFEMPDIVAVPIGGGTVIAKDGRCVGPHSVGSDLKRRALSHGGDTFTVTDLAAALERLNFGDSVNLKSVPTATIVEADSLITKTIREAIESVKPNAARLPIVFVGGGASLVDAEKISGGKCVRPPSGGVANAIGATLAQVSGQAEILCENTAESLKSGREKVITLASQSALLQGGNPETQRTLYVRETGLAYSGNTRIRLQAKVITDLSLRAPHR